MKLNRRKAMGAMAGGVIAAPQVAKMAAETKNTGTGSHIPPSLYNAKQQADYGMLETSLGPSEEGIRRMTKIANGDFSDSWQQSQLDETIDMTATSKRHATIEEMKSTSRTHKLQMISDLNVKHRKQKWIDEAKKQLESVAKMGGTCYF